MVSLAARLGYQIWFWPSGHMHLVGPQKQLPLNRAVKYGTYAGNKILNPCCSHTYWRLSQSSSIPSSGGCLGPQITLKSRWNQAHKPLHSHLSSCCQQHQNWTKNGSLPTSSSIWGTWNWSPPPHTVYCFSLAGPKSFQIISNSKKKVQD